MRPSSAAKAGSACAWPLPARFCAIIFPPSWRRIAPNIPACASLLRETNQLGAETLLQENEIDLAINELEGKPPAGIKSSVVFVLRLALLVPSDSPWRSAKQFLRENHPDEALISLPPEEALTRLFQKGFAARGRRFAIGVEVSSLESMRTYVARGFGIGLSVASPSATDAPEIRSLAITKFPKLILGALWIGTCRRFRCGRADRRPVG